MTQVPVQKLGIFANQMVWADKGMVDKLDMGPGKKVLDVDCGRGRIVHHVASFTGAKAVDPNIDPGQIKMGKDWADVTGLWGEKLEPTRGNYNHPLPFEDERFDELYRVQALAYAEDLVELLKNMHRVLKPGAKISFLDWFKLKADNPDDPHHRKMLRAVKALIGAVYTPELEE